jgi:hypothetical protein
MMALSVLLGRVLEETWLVREIVVCSRTIFRVSVLL